MHDEELLERVIAEAIAERKAQTAELEKQVAALELAWRVIRSKLDNVAASGESATRPDGSGLASAATKTIETPVAPYIPSAAVGAVPVGTNGATHLAGRKWPLPICDAAERVLVDVGRALSVDEIMVGLAPLGLTPSHSSVETALRKDKKHRFTKIAPNTFRLAEGVRAAPADCGLPIAD